MSRICAFCQRPVTRSPRARYCSNEHKELARTAKDRHRTLTNGTRQEVAARNEKFITYLQVLLQTEMPENAWGYQLGLYVEGAYHWFPFFRSVKGHKCSRRMTLYGEFTEELFFPMRPFEPPCVPVAGRYLVRFVTRFRPHVIVGREDIIIEVPYFIEFQGLPFNPKKANR